MLRLTHLNALHAIEVAIRRGSLKTAAEELGITPAALGQRIKSLEDYLGETLVLRGRNGVEAAPALREALPHLQNGFHTLSQAATLLRLESRNSIAVAADTDLADLWLAPRLEKFRKRFPRIQLEVNPGPTIAKPADCEIRFSRPVSGNGQTLLFHDYLAPVVSPLNNRRLANLPLKTRLEGFPLLHTNVYQQDPKALDWPAWVQTFGHRTTGTARGTSYQSVDLGLRAVHSHAGVMICGLILVLEAVENNTLCLPFPIREGAWTDYGYQLLVSAHARERPQVQRFVAWLKEEARRSNKRLKRFIAEK